MSKPPPFKRPSIELGGHGRSWQKVKVTQVMEGDIVAQRGLVDYTQYDTGKINIGFVNGIDEFYDLDEEIFAFVREVHDVS